MSQQELIVLLSAKLHVLDFETKKSISFMKMLKNKGPKIDPCVILQIMSHQLIVELSISTVPTHSQLSSSPCYD